MWKVLEYWVFSAPHFPAFGLNMGKFRPGKSLNSDNYHAVRHMWYLPFKSVQQWTSKLLSNIPSHKESLRHDWSHLYLRWEWDSISGKPKSFSGVSNTYKIVVLPNC